MSKPSASQIDLSPTSSKRMPNASAWTLPCSQATHLRAGFLTSAAKRGASLFKMMAMSRHRSTDTLTAYVRDQELFKDHAGAGLL
jgi:hypothetical protein